jgi:hypothetical protein
MKYVTKPMIVDAVKYVGNNLSEIREFCSVDNNDGSITENCIVENNQLYVINKGFVTPVFYNDFITRSIMNGLSVYSPEVFNYYYETANYSQEIITKYENKISEAPFQKDRFDHKVNSAIDVNYMQGKYIVFKQQAFSVCFYAEQIEQLQKIVNKIYDTIQNHSSENNENAHNNKLIENSKKELPETNTVQIKLETKKVKKEKIEKKAE